MATVKELGGGYYVCRKVFSSKRNQPARWSEIFRVKANNSKLGGSLRFTTVVCPKELVGKKVMVKVIPLRSKKEFKFEDLEEIYC